MLVHLLNHLVTNFQYCSRMVQDFLLWYYKRYQVDNLKILQYYCVDGDAEQTGFSNYKCQVPTAHVLLFHYLILAILALMSFRNTSVVLGSLMVYRQYCERESDTHQALSCSSTPPYFLSGYPASQYALLCGHFLVSILCCPLKLNFTFLFQTKANSEAAWRISTSVIGYSGQDQGCLSFN